jgi:proteasome lid subunit RPN8/RPN11
MPDNITPGNEANPEDGSGVPHEGEVNGESALGENVEPEEMSIDITLGEAKERTLNDMFTGAMLVQQSPGKRFKLNDGRHGRLEIYIRREVRDAIHAHARAGGRNEIFGLLLGHMEGTAAEPKLVISACIRSDDTLSERTSVTLPSEAWTPLLKRKDENHPEEFILGWYHSHPDFGIFLSEYDLVVQRTAFNSKHHLAYVVDPIRSEDGLFMWRGEEMVPATGYYILGEEEPPQTREVDVRQPSTMNLPLVSAVILILLLIAIMNISLVSGLGTVRREVDSMSREQIASADLDRRLSNMEADVQSVKNRQTAIGAKLDNLENRLFPPELEYSPQARLDEIREQITALGGLLTRYDFGTEENSKEFVNRLVSLASMLTGLEEQVTVYDNFLSTDQGDSP